MQTSEEEFIEDGSSRDDFFKKNEQTNIRQQQRALRLKEELAYGSGLSPAGKIRFTIGLFIFFFSIGITLLNDTDKAVNSLLNLTPDSLRVFCIIFGVLSTLFVFTSSKRHKALRYLSSITILALSYFMVDIFQSEDSDRINEPFIVEEEYINNKQVEEPTGRFISDTDLKNFNNLTYDKRTQSAYAIFIDQPDPVYRTQMRDYLHRVLIGASTNIYSRKRGYLYVIENAPYPMKDISKIAASLGKIYYAEPEKGIYEVQYDSDIAHMSNRYSQEVINTPTHPAYVYANIEELHSKVSDRVARAAQSLSASNSSILRVDILDNLSEVIKEPWESEPHTYNCLMTALITYSSLQNDNTANECLRFVKWNQQNNKSTPPLVINYLIDAKPDIVAPFIIDQWINNPIVWNSFLEKLGPKAEDLLIEQLKVTKDLHLVSNIIHHFGQFGSAKVLPYVTKLQTHPDKLINQAAQKAKLLIEQRVEADQ
ncbi:MAG: hypothetical protein R3Y56_01685 [Akkermansia sp.]